MIDWDKGRYVQSEVLRLVPRLTPKRLLNWVQRGLVNEAPNTRGRGDHRRYSPMGIIMLDFVANVAVFGVDLASAFDLAEDVADIAESLIKRAETLPTMSTEKGTVLIAIGPGYMANFKRAKLTTLNSGAYYLVPIESVDAHFDRMLNQVYLVVEIEMLIADAIK